MKLTSAEITRRVCDYFKAEGQPIETSRIQKLVNQINSTLGKKSAWVGNYVSSYRRTHNLS